MSPTSSIHVAPPVRAVFLDIGHTVIRPEPSWESIYVAAFAEFGVDIEISRLAEALHRAYHHGGYGFDAGWEPTEQASYDRAVAVDRVAIEELGLDPLPDDFFRYLSGLFLQAERWHVYPDALPALDALRARGLTLGAVSNWVWGLPELLHDLDLVTRFDFIVASARVGYEKPHRGIFEHALAQADVPAASVIHVGDHMDADVRGAQAVGIEGVLIDREGRQPDADGARRITSLDELLPIIDARNGRHA
ncbi:MAG: HAD-IA family hydrolase [Chloroflexota bacterium]